MNFDINQHPKIRTLWQVVTHPLCILFLTNLLVYGIFIPLLGLYWDDLDFYWLYSQSGTTGLAHYFAIDNPVLGWFYQINFRLLGIIPWHWQVFSFFWRWLCAAGIFFLVRQYLKNHLEPALMVSLVFLLFPAFSQQSIAMCYGHYQIALASLAFSLGLSLYVIDHPKSKVALTALATFLSALNLFVTEYFFMLELMRPILLWVYLAGRDNRIRETLKRWAPFLVVFLAAAFWRTFIFSSQTATYSFKTFSSIENQPFQGIAELGRQVSAYLWHMLVAGWQNVFQFPALASFGKSATLLYIGVSVVLVILLASAIFTKERTLTRRNALLLIVTGLIASLLGGIPYWSTGLMLGGTFPNDRFALSFMLGSGLFFTGVLYLLPAQPTLRRSIFVILLALAGGLQVRNGMTFKRDWENLQRFMWQVTWRIPGIQPNTIVFSNDMPLEYFSDLSLTAPLNVTYDDKMDSTAVPYVYYFPTVRKTDRDALTLSPDQPITHDLYIGDFQGNTNRSITLYYAPPACLRIVDTEIESDNWMLPLYVRQTAALSPDGIRLIDPLGVPNLAKPIFEKEPVNDWCHAFEQADLARQERDWQKVVALGDQFITGSEKPVDPMERLVYIEGYANTGNWQLASEISETTLAVTKAMQPPLCSLWKRIDRETPASEDKENALRWAETSLSCSFQ